MTHYLDQGLERWLYRTAHENAWKVAPLYNVNDLIGEGFLCYQKCVDRYGRLQRKRRPTKDDRKNFMALVKTTFLRRIIDLARERTRKPDRYTISQLTGPEQSIGDWFDRNSPVEAAGADLRLMLEAAPTELRQLFTLLLSDARKTRFVKFKVGKHYHRETSNERLCRLLWGLSNKAAKRAAKVVDIRSEIEHYFEHGEWRLGSNFAGVCK